MRRARRDLDVRADDTVRAEHPDAEVGDVHRAALPAAASPLAAEEFAHHGLWIRAFHEGVAVSAMGGEQQIVAFEIRADSRRARFLADRRMQRSGNEAVVERRERGFLECAHAAHVAVVAGQALGVDVGAVHLRGPPGTRFRGRARPGFEPPVYSFARDAAFR